MKTRNSKKVIKEIDSILQSYTKFGSSFLRYSDLVRQFKKAGMPWSLFTFKYIPELRGSVPRYEIAICKSKNKDIVNPTKYGWHETIYLLKLLKEYIENNTKNGWVDWTKLLKASV